MINEVDKIFEFGNFNINANFSQTFLFYSIQWNKFVSDWKEMGIPALILETLTYRNQSITKSMLYGWNNADTA